VPKKIPDDDLLDDLRAVAAKIGPPSRAEYKEKGEYGSSTLERRFGSWPGALETAGLEPTTQYQIPEDELVEDLRRVASSGKGPSTQEYQENGHYTSGTIARRLGSGSWNEALRTAGLEINEVHKYPDEQVLRALRDRANGDLAPSQSEVADEVIHCPKTYATRYGTYWKGAVAAGLKPQTKRPLEPSKYANYIQEAQNLSLPSQRITCLLRAFTGLGRYLLKEFNTDWISYIESDRRSTLIQVPGKHLPVEREWNIKIPTKWHSPVTQERENTQLEGLLRWCIEHDSDGFYSESGSQKLTNRVYQEMEIDRNYADLKMSLGTHLAEREADPWFIEKQTGINVTNSEIEVSYFFLWNHVHREITHPDYEPPETILNPV